MDELAPFIGEWSMAVDMPHVPDVAPDAEARCVFEWMPGERFLLQRWEISIPEAPDGIALIGLDEGRGTLLQHYFDSRGVARVYEMTFDGRRWTTNRSTPDFSDLNFHQRWDGEFRPGHFGGVTTVVARLLGIVSPQTAYFGDKDWQQLQVVRRMVADLAIPVEIAGCPIVREPDGLALSSRNVYLSPEQRQYATALSRALRAGQARYAAGERDAETLRESIAAVLLDTPGVRPDYVAVVDPQSLEPLTRLGGATPRARALIAARLGHVRLIDNAPLPADEPSYS